MHHSWLLSMANDTLHWPRTLCGRFGPCWCRALFDKRKYGYLYTQIHGI